MLNIYLNTWGNYNVNGADLGEWVSLPMDESELEEKMEEIAERMHDNDPEWFINDYMWDGSFSPRSIEELENIFELNEWIQELDNLNTWELEIYEAACEIFGANNVELDELDSYCLYSDIDNEYDLGYHFVHECGYDLDNMGTLANYIDYEAFGRDINLESYSGFSKYGWIQKC